jgi:hypothetical protein
VHMVVTGQRPSAEAREKLGQTLRRFLGGTAAE